jgi:hypothetical protein
MGRVRLTATLCAACRFGVIPLTLAFAFALFGVIAFPAGGVITAAPGIFVPAVHAVSARNLGFVFPFHLFGRVCVECSGGCNPPRFTLVLYDSHADTLDVVKQTPAATGQLLVSQTISLF